MRIKVARFWFQVLQMAALLSGRFERVLSFKVIELNCCLCVFMFKH